MSPVLSRRTRLRGATRGLAVGCALAAVATLGAAALLGPRLAAREEAASRHARERAVRSLARLEADLARALEGVARHLEQGGPEAQALARGGAAAYDVARGLAAGAGLDGLEVLGDDGIVRSSAGFPERAGERDGALLRLPHGRAVLVSVQLPLGSRAAFCLARTVAISGMRLTLVGQRPVSDALLRELVADADAAIVGEDGVPLAPTRVPLDRWNAPHAARVEIAGHDRGPAYLVVARDAGSTALERGAWLRLLALAGAPAALAGVLAGWWGAGATRRPLEGLVRAIDAIAAGEADYDFPEARREELGELAAAFTRMRRGLDFQRERSRAAERVAAWREMARRVAHEVKNPLAPIRLTVENLRRARERAPERFERMFEEGTRTIVEEVDQLARLVGEFSEFARLPLPRRSPGDVRPLLDAALELFAAEPGLRVERGYDDDLPPVSLDADQLGRALKNVIGNAVEALRGAGRTEPVLRVTARRDGSVVRIEVQDNGPGLPPGAAGRVFEPYFTTKEHGTGLGLALSYRIVAEHDGTIAAQDVAGGGARFVIRLPGVAPGGRAGDG